MRRRIPENLARNAVEMRGEAGSAWVSGLPSLIAELEERWSLETGEPFPDLSFGWVAPARRADGSRAVLKLAFPADEEFVTGVEALKTFDGRGAVRVLDHDLEKGAVLLERLEPGTPLAWLSDDEEATRIMAGVMKKLWRPAPSKHPFPTVHERTRALARLRERFAGGTGPVPAPLVEEAEALFENLIPTQEAPPVLLHGDLHHANVLSSRRAAWLAIDPKGVVGEPAFEVGAMLHNPVGLLERPDPAGLLKRRVRILSEELGLDHDRVRGWGVAQAVLAACWSLEDTGKVWEEALVFARLLSGIRG